MQADWASLPPPLLQQVLWLALGDLAPLHLPLFLRPDTREDAHARSHAAAIANLAAVCRAWRAAAAAALGSGGPATWRVDVQRTAGVDLLRLEHLRVAFLNLRRLTWSEADNGAGCEALLTSPAFQTASGRHLTSIVGVPERLAPLLAGFPNLAAVGLAEDYTSTAFGVAGMGARSHLACMRLRPLHCLPLLRRLTLELGAADLASLPPQVDELVLMEVDRVVLPAGIQGASVADRLLTVAEAAGEEPRRGVRRLGRHCWPIQARCRPLGRASGSLAPWQQLLTAGLPAGSSIASATGQADPRLPACPTAPCRPGQAHCARQQRQHRL